MMPSPAQPCFVQLKAGVVVRLEAVQLLLELQARGFRLSPDDGAIWIRPFSTLTNQDRSQIKLWKGHLLAILETEAPRVQ